MKKFFSSIDWSKVLSYGTHIALLAGAIALKAYDPSAYGVWGPLLQVAGQVIGQPEGITLLNKGGA